MYANKTCSLPPSIQTVQPIAVYVEVLALCSLLNEWNEQYMAANAKRDHFTILKGIVTTAACLGLRLASGHVGVMDYSAHTQTHTNVMGKEVKCRKM